MVYLSFNLKSLSTVSESNEVILKDYNSVYTPLIKFLYKHHNFCFNFSFSGLQIQFFKKKKNEFISIVKELISRKQVEILGGGYYSPVLPLICNVDRTGQIDMLTTEIRQVFGKRPRGITLFADCWDSSVVSSLKICGIEYVYLDSSLVPQNKRKFLPVIMSDQGKTIEIISYDNTYLPDNQMSPEDFIANILKSVEKVNKKDTYLQMQPDRIVSVNLSHDEIVSLLEQKWFEKLDTYLTEHPETGVTTTTYSNYRKNNLVKVPAHISIGINSSISDWLCKTYNVSETKYKKVDFYDFLEENHLSRNLYNRIIYISMLVNQYKSDKIRKQAARDKLWQAENGNGLLFNSEGTIANASQRQQAYKYLIEAEKILREDSNFTETVTSFDYNGDGLNEFICRMQNYFSYISLISGAVQELEILKITGNYADNFSRRLEYDGCNDEYERGIFIDHLFTSEQFEKYCNGEPAGDGIFSKIQYSENKFSAKHHEIQLCANAVFVPTKQKVFLRKKYIISSSGMIIQYILRNESDKPLKAVFAVESNLAHTNYIQNNVSYYNLELIAENNKVTVDTSKSLAQQFDNKTLDKIDIIRMTDSQSGVSFGFEPNEICGYSYYPIHFKRPSLKNSTPENVQMTFVSTMFWNIDLEPGMETEKTINFTITSVKKERLNQLSR